MPPEPPSTHPKHPDSPAPDGQMGDAELLATSPFADDPGPGPAARTPQSPRPGATLYLAAGVILVAGFLGGVQAHKWSSDGSSGAIAGGPEGGRTRTNGYGAPPGASAPRGGYGGPPGAPGTAAGGSGTAGTVTKVVGRTLYLRTASGETVKVETTGTTKFRIFEDGRLRDLGAGTTVVVQGSPGRDGSLTATAVNEGSGR
ncbi:hypothetical protein [Actinomadura sp. WMMA1423]|uniref:hypothetical protein n=1 Tax=Actinomadura sp. WMMA1423 TaxID=2591108 RepID=UPI001146E70F|nr:hypothetical protein [Actinomadura sp. WMMA1423]